MCRLTNALRHMIGIHDFIPTSTTRARVRRKVGHGARSRNGHGPGLDAPTNPVIANLAREHRLIRQMAADAVRRWGRRQGD